MRKLLVVLIVMLLATGLAVELVAPGLAEGRIEEGVRRESRDVTGVHADLGTFPIVTKLVLTSRVNRLTVTLDEVVRRGVRFTRVSIALRGITFDRDAAFRREVRVRDIDSGTVTARLPLGRLSGLVGQIAGGIDARVSGNTLVLSRDGRSLLSVAVPADLFPCAPAASVEGDDVVLQCTFDRVPDSLKGLAEG